MFQLFRAVLNGEAKIATLPQQRRSRLPAFAIAATVLVACGAALFEWQMQTQPAAPPPKVATICATLASIVFSVATTLVIRWPVMSWKLPTLKSHHCFQLLMASETPGAVG